MSSESNPASRNGAPVSLILEAVEEVNTLLPSGRAIETSHSAALAKPDGPLDSLGLVNLIVAVEDRVQRRWGRSAGLMEALALPVERSPFRTVETLSAYLVERGLEGSGFLDGRGGDG